MTGFGFTGSPAYATIGEALRLAARYWRASWERWVLAVVAVAVVNGLAGWLLGGGTVDQPSVARALFPGAGGGRLDPSELPRLVAGPLAVGIVGMVAEWFFVANAIAGLRGREVTLPWVLAAGLRTFVADLLVALTFVTVGFVALGLGALGIILLLGLLPVLLYLAVRLQLWTLAIFDGSSVGGGARRSWMLTRGAVLRALGWGLAVFGLGLVLTVANAAIGFALGGVPALGSAVTSAIGTTFQAFTVLVMAVLYEGQRLRNEPPPVMAWPAWPVDAYGRPVGADGQPFDPDGPPPPPAPPPTSWPGA